MECPSSCHRTTRPEPERSWRRTRTSTSDLWIAGLSEPRHGPACPMMKPEAMESALTAGKADDP